LVPHVRVSTPGGSAWRLRPEGGVIPRVRAVGGDAEVKTRLEVLREEDARPPRPQPAAAASSSGGTLARIISACNCMLRIRRAQIRSMYTGFYLQFRPPSPLWLKTITDD
jgi:hypothetical protein